jgi:hypothetical protein
MNNIFKTLLFLSLMNMPLSAVGLEAGLRGLIIGIAASSILLILIIRYVDSIILYTYKARPVLLQDIFVLFNSAKRKWEADDIEGRGQPMKVNPLGGIVS